MHTRTCSSRHNSRALCSLPRTSGWRRQDWRRRQEHCLQQRAEHKHTQTKPESQRRTADSTAHPMPAAAPGRRHHLMTTAAPLLALLAPLLPVLPHVTGSRPAAWMVGARQSCGHKRQTLSCSNMHAVRTCAAATRGWTRLKVTPSLSERSPGSCNKSPPAAPPLLAVLFGAAAPACPDACCGCCRRCCWIARSRWHCFAWSACSGNCKRGAADMRVCCVPAQ